MTKVRSDYIRPVDFKHGRVDMTHGGGGRAMAQLIEELFARAFANEWLAQGNDNALFTVDGGRMVMATDSHVVSPLEFPGGDIGCLAVHGTINDVAMSGAMPLYLAAGFILEEGFPLANLKRIVESMAAAARDAGVPIVTGDTKVVEKGKGDGVFITTTGIGVVPPGVEISGNRARPGDAILVSGTIGDHGVAIMSLRENLSFETTIRSDTAALHGLVATMVSSVPAIRCLRDPTRGGLGTTLNEFARQSGVGMLIHEARIPVRAEVSAACEFLGLDPLYVANEGKLIAICPPEDADRLLAAMRAHPLGADAAIIGEVVADTPLLRPDGDELRRPPRRRLADGRTAAAHLLTDLPVRILLLAHSFNSLTQRLWIELADWGHEVSLELDVNDAVTSDAVRRWSPDVVIAPFLKRAIPESVWSTRALPGRAPGHRRRPRPLGARLGGAGAPAPLGSDGPAGECRDGCRRRLGQRRVPHAGREQGQSLPQRSHRGDRRGAAIRARAHRAGASAPVRSTGNTRRARAECDPLMRQADRAIDWRRDPTDLVLRKLRAADGTPGVADEVLGLRVHCYDAHPEGRAARPRRRSHRPARRRSLPRNASTARCGSRT